MRIARVGGSKQSMVITLLLVPMGNCSDGQEVSAEVKGPTRSLLSPFVEHCLK
jgi:hypothetical protein